MIFLGNLIYLPEVDAHSITNNYPLRNKLITLIRYNSHTSFLGDTMHRTNPSTISNRINNTSFENFYYLILYHIFHLGIKVALMFDDWLGIRFNINFVLTGSKRNSLQIIKSISHSSTVFLQYLQ